MRRIIAVLLTATALIGCTPALPARKAEESLPPQRQAAAITTVKLFTFQGDRRWDEVIRAFSNKNPDIRIQATGYQIEEGHVYWNEIIREPMKNREIDIIPLLGNPDGTRLEPFLAALDPYIKRSGLDLTPYAEAIEPLRKDGILSAIPVSLSPDALMLNVDLFKAAGLPLPRHDWTWDEFRDTAARLTSGLGEEKIWGLSADWGLHILANSMVASLWGKEPPNPRAEKALLQLWSTMVDTDRSAPASPKPTAALYDQRPRGDFLTGKAAMTPVKLTYFAYEQRGAKFQTDIVPVPLLPGAKPAVTVMPEVYGIVEGSPNTEAAWRFLQFLLTEDGAVALARGGQFPLIRTEAVKQAWFDQTTPPPPGTEAFFTLPLRSVSDDYQTKSEQVRGVFTGALFDVLAGGADVERVWADYARVRDGILK